MTKPTKDKLLLLTLAIALIMAAIYVGFRHGYRAGQLDYAMGLKQWTVIDGIEIRIYGPYKDYQPLQEEATK